MKTGSSGLKEYEVWVQDKPFRGLLVAVAVLTILVFVSVLVTNHFSWSGALVASSFAIPIVLALIGWSWITSKATHTLVSKFFRQPSWSLRVFLAAFFVSTLIGGWYLIQEAVEFVIAKVEHLP
jgi:hypothetical protein